MTWLENPVLQRELIVNLRTNRSFLLLFAYQLVLALVVFFAWPTETRLEANAVAARRLVDFFFLGQYVLASLMAPSFAAGAITGEKERKTYEMLLASPIGPSSIVFGKLVASLTHLAILIFCSLPIVMLCLPLGGVSVYEVLAAYVGLTISVVTFGMISVACSGYFRRTMASLVASYLLILPLAMTAVITWQALAGSGKTRLLFVLLVLPALAIPLCVFLFLRTSHRLLYPPDVGSEGKEVVDLDQEAEEVVGLVIQRDKFPDKLFAPEKRVDLLADGANPVYDKEIHSEIFSQGTLMMRLVIQISMLLAIPIMAWCLFIAPAFAPWYVAYVLVFNLLVGPVFLAGSVTSERERQTLDLMLTTAITPWQILWGKLVAGLRISTVLTLFLVWPLFLACLIFLSLNPVGRDNFYWTNLRAMGAYLSIILATCATTGILALFFSVVFRRTVVSLTSTYLILVLVFCVPLGINYFVTTFYPNELGSSWTELIGVGSPFAATFSVPLTVTALDRAGLPEPQSMGVPKNWNLFIAYLSGVLIVVVVLLLAQIRLFQTRWRVAQ